mmetsp:Transcript_17583/g.22813  ORF Transcript_17583/g.22813 Transcript_17583/m.22813 type:complete len:259 (-) Transcript_17583:760-1536(-)|eukprot:CAMPEP_0117750556 /NCGR_PEP_ID=MMETSP0947-20121206/10442_1 /TAXON_ID=44440 /ORGANISM="Chattonella subsalsa, Strain CCMP2191" /LENGTH=258 /DNA_ID=CAMNT_0005568753 /DNA_START=143 /DNA_END=919 /DNA_ORIENTATION=+
MGNCQGHDSIKDIQFSNRDVLVMVKDSSERWTKLSVNYQKIRGISPKFRKLIDRSFLNIGNNKSVVKIEGIDFSMLNIILNYCHGYEVEFDMSLIGKIRKVASTYVIEDLLHDIDDVILDKLTYENFCDFYKSYGKLNDLSLLQSCADHLKYLSGDPNHVLKSDQFMELRFYPELQLVLQAIVCLDIDETLLWSRCRDWAAAQGSSSHQAFRQISQFLSVTLANASNINYKMNPILEDDIITPSTSCQDLADLMTKLP